MIKEYHIGVYQDQDGWDEVAGREFHVFIPEVYHAYGIDIPYDDLNKNSKSELYTLAEGIKYAMQEQAKHAHLQLLDIIVMKDSTIFYIRNETDAIECILTLS